MRSASSATSRRTASSSWSRASFCSASSVRRSPPPAEALLPRIRSATARPIGEKAIAMHAPPENEDDGQDVFHTRQDRKSTRLNSSHGYISYAVFCLKKKKHKSR